MSSTVATRAARSAAYLARVLDVVLADLGLSLPQYRLLAHLARGTTAATPVAKELSISRPSITALVDGVVAKNLVERQGDPSDRRRVMLVITAAGNAAVEQADEAIGNRLMSMATYLPEADAVQATTALSHWLEAMKLEAEAAKVTAADAAGAAS